MEIEPESARRGDVMYRLGSLFSGIGGAELGFEWTGQFQTVFQVEREPFCQKVLAKHWPKVPRFDDVCNVGSHNLPACDVLVAGFPCQPHSLIGTRAASADERDLWGECARLVRELRPAVAVFENVRGLLSSEDGRFFSRVLSDLGECGYDAEWQVLRASDFGAHHQRGRVFIVAYPNGNRLQGLLSNSQKSFKVGDSRDSSDFRADVSNGLLHSFATRAEVLLTSRNLGNVNGTSRGLDGRKRLKALGNAIVPQVAQFVAQRILNSGVLEGGM